MGKNQVMKRAWEIAKEASIESNGNCKDYFPQSLKIAWDEYYAIQKENKKMEIIKIKQRSAEWHIERLGKLTASQIKDVITSTGKKASGWDKTAYKLAAEIETGESEYISSSYWMQRGIMLEDEALKKYKKQTGNKAKKVGLIKHNKYNVAVSPDGVIKDIGGLEIKCPAPKKQKEYQIKKVLPLEYRPQVYFSLWVSGFDFWDFYSYHPDMDPFYIRITKEDKDYKKWAEIAEILIPQLCADVESYTFKKSKPKKEWLARIQEQNFNDEFII